MSKFSKMFLIFCILFIFLISHVYALQENTDSYTNVQTATFNDNTVQYDYDSSQVTQTSTPTQSNTINNSSTRSTVSYITQLPESGLGLTNILNIFLIVIGVLLILFAIAILIKAK